MKINQKDLAIMTKMYDEAGKGDHFKNNILPKINSQEDLEDLTKNSFGDRKTRAQFDGVLSQNEFVDQFFNIYQQRVINIIAGDIPYITAFLKDAPFSGSRGYISEDVKVGKEFTSVFSESTFNPEKRIAYLQTISTSIRRQYDDQLSITIIGRAANKEGGLDNYITQRIGYLNEDFIAEIRVSILAVIELAVGKILEITVPTELQGITMKEQKARFIMEKISEELKYMKDNSADYSDNGFITRQPLSELIGLYSRPAYAELAVHGLGMLRNKEGMNGISVGNEYDIPATDFYAKFMPAGKIHYSNSINVSGKDTINKNMKVVYSKTVFTELDTVDSQPCLTVVVVDETPAAAAKRKPNATFVNSIVVKASERAKATAKRREAFYKKIAAFYGKSATTIKAPKAEIVNTDDITE